ncbi:peptidoglycan binding domain-containing protein [Paenibacillus hexagrammi]|uniref:Peptidoglycan binding domain-containing protein n=1 Tax=Paenibacillus hexagrammi TaxID=2908839 RepID=A0ABY3SIH0_9BACL|nr:peptidoglycan binding domain-containing protein [Paenibacillus sp. YPD9-1]UJF33180.1 peptidoglycan binding domain-containing protein [Paenibacillus sp. YPD9-1]
MLSNSVYLTPARKILLLAAIVIVSASAAGGALYTYGSGQKLPSHFQVAGWNAGGMPHEVFEQQLEQRWRQISSLPVQLQSTNPEITGKTLSLEQLGIVLHREQVDRALQSLLHGSMANRISARWSLSHADLPMSASIDTNKLQAVIQQSWKEVYDHQPTAARRIVNPDDTIQYEPDRSVPRIDLVTLKKQLDSLIPPVTPGYMEQKTLQITIPLYEQPASVTVDSLKQQKIERKIAQFTTSFPPAERDGFTISDPLPQPSTICS